MKLLLKKADVSGYLPAPIQSHFSQAALFLFLTLHQHVSPSCFQQARVHQKSFYNWIAVIVQFLPPCGKEREKNVKSCCSTALLVFANTQQRKRCLHGRSLERQEQGVEPQKVLHHQSFPLSFGPRRPHHSGTGVRIAAPANTGWSENINGSLAQTSDWFSAQTIYFSLFFFFLQVARS